MAICEGHDNDINPMAALEEKFISLPRQVNDALDTIDAILAIGESLMDDPAGTNRTLARYLVQLRLIKAAARDVAAIGLHCLCVRFEKNLVMLLDAGRLLSVD